jgi:hypothetical protein
VGLLSVNTGFALCLIPVVILGLHEVAIAVKAYEQNGYENFYHGAVPYVCIIALIELMVNSKMFSNHSCCYGSTCSHMSSNISTRDHTTVFEDCNLGAFKYDQLSKFLVIEIKTKFIVFPTLGFKFFDSVVHSSISSTGWSGMFSVSPSLAKTNPKPNIVSVSAGVQLPRKIKILRVRLSLE